SERADDRDDLDDAGEDPDQEPVAEAVEPERKAEERRDERDQEELAADERAELEVDQIPGVADDLAPVARDEREDEPLRPLALEHPVGRNGEGEDDPDDDLER